MFHETDLKKILVTKFNFRFFSVKYFDGKKEKPLRFWLKSTCGPTNREQYDENALRLDNESKCKVIFNLIRNKKNEIEGNNNMFIIKNKIKTKLLGKQK